MTREELLTLLRAARPPHPGVQILVVGSQSVLGAFPDSDLPQRATLSLEADVMYLREGRFDQELTDMVDAWFGEGSQFHEQHGVYLQGVDEDTCVLPSGWQDRLVHLVDLPAPVGPADDVVGGTACIPVFCLDPHDLAVAKLAAGRPERSRFRERAAGIRPSRAGGGRGACAAAGCDDVSRCVKRRVAQAASRYASERGLSSSLREAVEVPGVKPWPTRLCR